MREILAAGEFKASVVSYWDLTFKKGRQNAPVLHPAAWWDCYMTRTAVEVLPIRVAHIDPARRASRVAPRDPFDRMLVARALSEDCAFVSRDGMVARYGALVVWE